MRQPLFLISLLLSSAACSPADDFAEDVGVDETAGEATEAGAQATETPSTARARLVEEENELYSFEFKYPAQAGRVEGLRVILETRLEQARAELARQSQEDRDAMAGSDFTYRQHSLAVDWEVVAELPDWVSMSAEISSYTGGAHGNFGFDSLLWNKKEGTLVDATDLFLSQAALGQALSRRYCERLDAMRARRRGAPVDPDSTDSFDMCPDITELTVLLGSSNGETFNRLGLLAAPYVAGPWAEGPYEVTLGVDTQVLDAVRPEYASDFSILR